MGGCSISRVLGFAWPCFCVWSLGAQIVNLYECLFCYQLFVEALTKEGLRVSSHISGDFVYVIKVCWCPHVCKCCPCVPQKSRIYVYSEIFSGNAWSYMIAFKFYEYGDFGYVLSATYRAALSIFVLVLDHYIKIHFASVRATWVFLISSFMLHIKRDS